MVSLHRLLLFVRGVICTSNSCESLLPEKCVSGEHVAHGLHFRPWLYTSRQLQILSHKTQPRP